MLLKPGPNAEVEGLNHGTISTTVFFLNTRVCEFFLLNFQNEGG